MATRTVEDRIKELEAKIAAIKARDERKRAKKNPAVAPLSQALKSLDKALNATDDKPLRTALDESRTIVVSCLGLLGITPKAGKAAKAGRPARKRAAKASAPELTAEAVLAHLAEHPGSKSEEISAALGTDAVTLRPLLQQLIDDEKVATEGERRGRRYIPASIMAAATRS